MAGVRWLSPHGAVALRRGANHGESTAFPFNEKNTPMTEAAQFPVLPDRLSVDPRSPHHVAAVFAHDVGIRLNGKVLSTVEEYCISEGWVKLPAGKTLDRKGQPLLIKLKGKVEAFYR